MLKATSGGSSSGTSFTGSIAATQVAFGSGANAFSGSANFTYVEGTGLTLGSTNQFLAKNGTTTSPSYSFTANTQSGLYERGTGAALTFTISGANAVDIQANALAMSNTAVIGFNGNADPTLAAITAGISQLGSASFAFGNGTAGSFTAALKFGAATMTAAAPTVAASQIGYGSTTAATASAGSGGALPVTVQAYIIVNVAGTNFKIPYFAV